MRCKFDIVKIFMAMLAVASVAVACSKMDRTQDATGHELVVSPVGTSMTKAGETIFPNDRSFGLFAYYSECAGGTEWTSQSAIRSATPYLENVAFKKNGTVWCGYDFTQLAVKSYYWPISGSLLFSGYSPHCDESDAVESVQYVQNSSDVNVAPNPYMAIEFTQKTTPADMVDLMWFDPLDVSNGTTVSKQADAVSVSFKHALSKVEFRFVDVTNHYKLKGVILKGVVNEGIFYSGTTAGWLPDLTEVEDYELLPDSYERTLNNSVAGNLFIIPQYLDGIFPSLGTELDSGVDVVLEFTVFDTIIVDGGQQKELGQKFEIPLKNYTYRWMTGMSYTYTITANADPIEFDTPDFTIIEQVVSM